MSSIDDSIKPAKKLSVAEMLQMARAKKHTVDEPEVAPYKSYVAPSHYMEIFPESVKPATGSVKAKSKMSIENLINAIADIDVSYAEDFQFNTVLYSAIQELCKNPSFLSDMLLTMRTHENELAREYFEFQTRNHNLNEFDILNVTKRIIDNQINDLQLKSQNINDKITSLIRNNKSPTKTGTNISGIVKAYESVKVKIHQAAQISSIRSMKESNRVNQDAKAGKLPRKHDLKSAAASEAPHLKIY